MLSFARVRPFLPYVAAGVLAVAALGYIRSLQSEAEALQSQLGRKTQEVVALEESLRVVNEYESAGGAMRSLWAAANEPSTDTLSAPDSTQGEISRRVDGTVKIEADTLAGRSGSTRKPKGRYVHPVTGTGYEGTVWVRPPGTEIQYRIRLLPGFQDVSLLQTVDGSGVERTYLDLPSGLSVQSVSAQSARTTDASRQARGRWTSGWSVGAGAIARPDGLYGEARLGLSAGVRIAGDLRLSAELSAGMDSKIGSGPVRPISDVSLFLRW